MHPSPIRDTTRPTFPRGTRSTRRLPSRRAFRSGFLHFFPVCTSRPARRNPLNISGRRSDRNLEKRGIHSFARDAMEELSRLVANLTICLLTVVLIVEYVYRKRALRRDAELNRQKQQQLSQLSQELKALKGELSRKGEIAGQVPLIAKKMTEILPGN